MKIGGKRAENGLLYFFLYNRDPVFIPGEKYHAINDRQTEDEIEVNEITG